ncbi:MAG TPA: LysM peptidoglycan-binding domain-containing protein [Thermoleophilaceae bacterium]|nr:LysM peptidoglycan-binding domain-containing protein [Thermoleophilaceae bacterium]
MNHLSAHLRRSGSHDGLPFHPDCPTCARERLRGTPGGGALVSASARAGLTAVVLAASAAVAGSRAGEPAQAQTDTVPPVDEAPQMVSPEELDGQLADPSKEPPKADAQGQEDARAGARAGGTYVVEPGDTLWGIARAQLGGSPSNARIAGEVKRLWDLNDVAIGTGNPDLIMVGQRLKLR